MIEEDIQNIQQYYQKAIDFIVTYSAQVIIALVVLLLFLFTANKTAKFIKNQLINKNVDVTLAQFAANVVKFLVVTAGVVIALGKVGISITPFVAAIGAASLGAGLAMQGMLSNYGAGLAIILTRPFTIGNTISIKSITGVVKDIKLASTTLVNEEGEDILIPNKFIIGDIIHNSQQNKLVETHIVVAYNTDVPKCIELIQKLLLDNPQVNTDKSVQVGVNDFKSHGIELGLRYWVFTERYYEIKYAVNLSIMHTFEQNDIQIPVLKNEVKIIQN